MTSRILVLFFVVTLSIQGFALANETQAWAVPDPWMADAGLLRINVPSGHERVTIGIYRDDGAFVRELVPSVLEKGEELWQWDGKDDEGMRMPAGVYYIRVLSVVNGYRISQILPLRILRRAR
ncbi:MAG TPA: FlgD immunoglobulin-like domain containing protein [Spirochaetota bacterium]|nr:FlgD immunoglobulin-like domain containing protein [Spirochaetota bacterium]HPH02081.1 FlgD immunoglobulin-like domain containing protein [Spirochaetota bacterium]HPN82718.1 FlgD immunoglobulin-like domain containing protein [Spirochaetota bacterium]